MNKPHKHAELIKQWADGAEIEVRRGYQSQCLWVEAQDINWDLRREYRIKPQPVECWGMLYIDGTLSAISHPTEAAALSTLRRNGGGVDRIVHMREVVGE
jgi:hypothetical protein